MRLLQTNISKMTDSAKIELLTRAVFGDLDYDTLKETPGLMQRFSEMDRKLGSILYGGAAASVVIVLKFIGAPTELIWSFLSRLISH